jgi:cellulose biosynthesis protein BcsQ
LKIIALYNIKGGVGKSAGAINFAWLSSNSSLKTLLWDLDPQGASTYCLHKKEAELKLKELIKGKNKLSNHIIKTAYKNLYLLPSDFSLRNIDYHLSGENKSKHRLYDSLSELQDVFDAVFLDCPPGISKLAENVFYSADYILTPIIPSRLSLRSVQQIIRFIDHKGFKSDRIIPFFSMVDIRRKIHKDCMLDLQGKLPHICRNFIPYLSEIEKMSETRKPVVFSKPASRAAKAYENLWEEIKETMSVPGNSKTAYL